MEGRDGKIALLATPWVVLPIRTSFFGFTTTLTQFYFPSRTFSTMSTEDARCFENIREKFGRFRILIVGRANAGKTTILRGICNSTENPEIFDGDGNKV